MQRELNTINKQLKMIHKTFEERRNKHLLKYNLTSSQQEILFYLGFQFSIGKFWFCNKNQLH